MGFRIPLPIRTSSACPIGVLIAEFVGVGVGVGVLGVSPRQSLEDFRDGIVQQRALVRSPPVTEETKFALPGVDRGPAITAQARQMATGAARLLGAVVAVATSGVGGPE